MKHMTQVTLPRRWKLWVASTVVLAALAPLGLLLFAGKLRFQNMLVIATNLPFGIVGLNERWSESVQWIFYWHPMGLSIVALGIAYALYAGLYWLVCRKGLLPFVVLEALLVLNGVGLFRMCLLHGLK
jgi:hypothetical protein